MNNIEELKRFIYSATVTSGSGSQSFYIDAKNREEADARAANNESDGMYADDSEVTDLDALDYEDETTVDDFGDFPLISREQSLIAQLEAAQKERDGLREKVNQADTEWQKMADRILAVGKRAEKAEAELSAANERVLREYPATLPCPVRLEPGLILGKGLPIAMLFRALSRRADYEAEIYAMTPEQRAEHDQRTREGKKFISECIAPRPAGFTVEGEPAPIKYIVILQRAWCNDTGSGINYHSDLVEFDKRDKAIKYGFELQDSDDFNIGVLTNGALTSFDWMAKPLAETKDSLARIASVIGIEGNADAE